MNNTWARFEPRVRPDTHDGNLGTAVKAAVHDPLWLLCRQWQLGEFQGEDTGTPVTVRYRAEMSPITRVRARDARPVDYDRAQGPLEMLVEREPAPQLTLRDRAAAGARFLRTLAAHGAVSAAVRRQLVARYPIELTAEERREPEAVSFHALMSPRVPDGVKIATALRAGDLHDIPSADSVKDDWLKWFDADVAETPGVCWVAERLEYRFSVAGKVGGEEVVLAAPEYPGGGLDWYHFDRDLSPAASLGVRDRAPESRSSAVIPAPAAYPGMPADRFWEIEDARVNLPAIPSGPVDLARMLLVEFVTTYGNDWWIVPIDVTFGTLVRIVELHTTDTFGVPADIPPAPREGWRMFEVDASDDTARPVLAMLPVAADRQQSEAIEEVLMFRDELANMGWAVEHAVEGALGRRRIVSPPTPEPQAFGPALPFPSLQYVLTSAVPANWFPLVPVHAPGSDHRVLLRRGRVARFDAHGHELTPSRAAGRFLDGDQARVVFPDEEVPRAGRRLQRFAQHARWLEGRVMTWRSRRARAGRGEGSSGLRFDVAEPRRGNPRQDG
jgi:hypothetical protein